ncbi:MAG: hypothetical protein L0387_25215 [Acidobacteria bacterium]|nr:hypothetical protein [Acidobacteriota bacterium]MCI0718003.1 hypothetical protein [Acidobacteriota bacterium]
MNEDRWGLAPKGNPSFQATCAAGKRKGSAIKGDRLSVRIGQRVRVNGTERMCDSVAVFAEAQPDGTLVVRVVIFNPDWDEALQIACIRSRPDDAASLTALGCNLNHVAA